MEAINDCARLVATALNYIRYYEEDPDSGRIRDAVELLEQALEIMTKVM